LGEYVPFEKLHYALILAGNAPVGDDTLYAVNPSGARLGIYQLSQQKLNRIDLEDGIRAMQPPTSWQRWAKRKGESKQSYMAWLDTFFCPIDLAVTADHLVVTYLRGEQFSYDLFSRDGRPLGRNYPISLPRATFQENHFGAFVYLDDERPHYAAFPLKR